MAVIDPRGESPDEMAARKELEFDANVALPERTSMPHSVGLCPGSHTDEFYVPDVPAGYVCPSCDATMVRYVREAEVERLRTMLGKVPQEQLGRIMQAVDAEEADTDA